MLKKIHFHLQKYYIFITLLLAILLGLLLRLYGLTVQSYWFDEVFSIQLSNPIHSFDYVYQHALGDVHPPFYQSLLWIWYKFFGFSEFSGRFLSTLIGTFSIYAIYALARELYNREVGIYSALIVATNYFALLYSQEVRSNILMFLFSILSYLYFVKLIKDSSKKNISLYILFSTLVIYTHYFGFFLVATELFVFIYYLIISKIDRVKLIKIAVISAILMFIALLPLFQRILEHIHTASYWMPSPSPLFFIDYMKAFTLSPFLHKIFLILLFIPIGFIIFKKEYRDSTLLIIIWIIIAFAIPYIKSVTGFSILIERSMIIVLPALIILVSYGIYVLKINYIKIGIIGVIIFFSLYHIYRMGYYTKVSKDQFREVLQSIEKIDNTLPIYDFIMRGSIDNKYKSQYFKSYATMIDSKVEVYPALELYNKYKENRVPSCFWVVHAHKDYISTSFILKQEGMVRVDTIDKFQAQAFLYAYKTNPKICLKANNE